MQLSRQHLENLPGFQALGVEGGAGRLTVLNLGLDCYLIQASLAKSDTVDSFFAGWTVTQQENGDSVGFCKTFKSLAEAADTLIAATGKFLGNDYTIETCTAKFDMQVLSSDV